MHDSVRPTESQKQWLARTFGPEAWGELCAVPEFLAALNTSLGLARHMALRHLAAKEHAHRWHFRE